MTFESSFVDTASSVLTTVFESLNSIQVFGVGAGVWVYIFCVVGFLFWVVGLLLPDEVNIWSKKQDR